MHSTLATRRMLIEKVCTVCEPHREGEAETVARPCEVHECEPCVGTGTMSSDNGWGPGITCDVCSGSGFNSH